MQIEEIMHNQHGTAYSGCNILQFRPISPDSLPSLGPLADPRPGRSILPQPEPVLSPAAKLAHDVRNALCSLHMLAGLLEEPGVLAPSARRYADDLQSVADTLTRLVDTLTSNPKNSPGSRTESASEPYSASAGEALRACETFLHTAAGPSATVYISSESNLPPLALAEDALQRVLVNLVKNAGEAMAVLGGTVRITARRALSREHPAVLIHVSDNGPGIPAHALSQIFEPGFSSKQDQSCAPGRGLAVVRELVESVGGTVRVGSTRRRGTTFELRIPSTPS